MHTIGTHIHTHTIHTHAICTYTKMHICTYRYVYICTYACTCIHICIHTYCYTCTNIHAVCACLHAHTIHTCASACTYYTHVCMSACTYAYFYPHTTQACTAGQHPGLNWEPQKHPGDPHYTPTSTYQPHTLGPIGVSCCFWQKYSILGCLEEEEKVRTVKIHCDGQHILYFTP